jgi:hypothetical protein
MGGGGKKDEKRAKAGKDRRRFWRLGPAAIRAFLTAATCAAAPKPGTLGRSGVVCVAVSTDFDHNVVKRPDFALCLVNFPPNSFDKEA